MIAKTCEPLQNKPTNPQELTASGVLSEIQLGKRYAAKDRRTIQAIAKTLGIKPLLLGNGLRRFYRALDVLRAEEKAASGR